jgi:hypothetical protein
VDALQVPTPFLHKLVALLTGSIDCLVVSQVISGESACTKPANPPTVIEISPFRCCGFSTAFGVGKFAIYGKTVELERERVRSSCLSSWIPAVEFLPGTGQVFLASVTIHRIACISDIGPQMKAPRRHM